jgi:hypothetical protein
MMKSKALITTLTLAASLSLTTTASADTTRDQIEQQGNAQITQLWNEYQQALQDRQNAWNQTQGNRYSDAYMNADAHAGAALQEYERAKTQLGDDLHSYDVSQYQKQQERSTTPATSSEQKQSMAVQSTASQTAARKQQPSGDTKPATIAQEPQASQTASATAKMDNLSSQSQKPTQATTESPMAQATKATDQTGQLPQTGNAISWLAPLLGMLGIGIAAKEARRDE